MYECTTAMHKQVHIYKCKCSCISKYTCRSVQIHVEVQEFVHKCTIQVLTALLLMHKYKCKYMCIGTCENSNVQIRKHKYMYECKCTSANSCTSLHTTAQIQVQMYDCLYKAECTSAMHENKCTSTCRSAQVAAPKFECISTRAQIHSHE